MIKKALITALKEGLIDYNELYGIDDNDFVLATEDGIIVFTEDGENAIEMLPDSFSARSMQLVNDRSHIRFINNGNIRFNN